MKATTQGRIIHVGDLCTSNSGVQYREIVITEIDCDYPKTISFSVFKERALMEFAVGQNIEICVNVESRQGKGRFFTSLTAYKVVVLGGYKEQSRAEAPSRPAQQQYQSTPRSSSDDLTF